MAVTAKRIADWAFRGMIGMFALAWLCPLATFFIGPYLGWWPEQTMEIAIGSLYLCAFWALLLVVPFMTAAQLAVKQV